MFLKKIRVRENRQLMLVFYRVYIIDFICQTWNIQCFIFH